MAGLRCIDVQSRPLAFLDLPSITREEFQPLVPPFATAFQAHMAAWRRDGNPRTARPFTVYTNCPLPPPEDRLFFILTYLKPSARQVVQGRLCGLGQGKANQWSQVLLPALLAALRLLGAAPTRSLSALAQRLGGAAADAATVVTLRQEEGTSPAGAPAAMSASPLLPLPAPSDASAAPKPLLHRKRVRAARQRTTR